MANTELRAIEPMSTADIIDSAISMYRHNFLPFFLITAIAYAPAVLAQILTSAMMANMETMPEEGADPLAVMAAFGLVVGAAWLVYAVAIPIAQGALIWAVSRRYLDQSITVAHAYQVVWRRVWQILVVIIITGIATMVGTLACIIPGLILWVMFSFAVPEVVLNDRTAFEAIQESWNLARYDFWKVATTLVLLALLVSVATYALTGPVMLGLSAAATEASQFLLQALSQTISVVVQAVLQPVAIVGMILLYYDLRIRRDGLDLQLLAEAIEVDTSAETLPVPQPGKDDLFGDQEADLPPRIDSEGEN